MKKVYTSALLFSTLLLSGCSKDFFRKYDKRIVGTWQIADVNRVGIGGGADKLPFNDGTLVFGQDGSLTYINSANVRYEGNWDIVLKTINDQTVHSLQISAVDFNSREVLTEYYDNMYFIGTNRFSAEVVQTFKTFVTKFRR